MRRLFQRIPKHPRVVPVYTRQDQSFKGTFAILSLATLCGGAALFQNEAAEAKPKEFNDLDYCV
jgi:hypothetical protein